MIYRGEIYYGEKLTTLFVVYGSKKSVIEAVTAAFSYYENQGMKPTMSIDNLFKYEFEVLKGLINKKWSGLYLPDESDVLEPETDRPHRRFWFWKRDE